MLLDHGQGRQGPAQAPGAHAGPVRQAGGRQRAYGCQLGGLAGLGSDPAEGGNRPAAGHPGDGQETGGGDYGDEEGQEDRQGNEGLIGEALSSGSRGGGTRPMNDRRPAG